MLEFRQSMHSDLKLAIELQNLDERIKGLTDEISSLPKHIAAIEKTLDSHVRKLEADRAALTANQRERKRMESDIQDQERKASKLKEQMMEAKTNEQYRAFQKEIEYCQGEVRKAEDRILDLMSESEPLEHNVGAAEAALKEEKQRVEAEKVTARERTDVDKKQLDELLAERRAAVEAMTAEVHSAYERIRERRRGRAVADATDGRCSACHMALRPQFFQELRANDAILYCESCGRMLYYNPPESFEQDIDAQPRPASSSL